jgi:CHAT domain-containing protein
MNFRLFICSILILLFGLNAFAQCPRSDSLWNHIVFLRDVKKSPLKEQQEELLPYVEKLKSCPYSRDSSGALLLARFAALRFLQGDFANGVRLTRQSMQIIYDNAANTSVNPAHLIKSYNNLRICYDSLHQERLRVAAIDSCIAISLRLHTGYDFSLPLIEEKMRTFFQKGDYYRCIYYGEIAEKVATEKGYPLNYRLNNFVWQINALIQLRKFTEADRLTQDKLLGCEKEALLTKNVAALYALAGTIKKEMGNTAAAEYCYRKSYNYYQKLADTTNYAPVLNSVGYMFSKELKQYERASTYYKQALRYGGIQERINIYDNIAGMHVQQGEFDSAFFYFQKAFDEIKPGLNEKYLLQHANELVTTNLTEYITNVVLDKAEALLLWNKKSGQRKSLVGAIENYKTIDHLFDKIKSLQSESQSKLFWRQHIRRLYENAIEACYLQQNPTEAFYFFEKSRAVLLQDALNEQRFLRSEDMYEQTQVNKKIVLLETSLQQTSKSSKAYDSLQAELLSSKQELDRLRTDFKEKNQFYYQSFLDTNFVTVEDVDKKLLNDHQAIVEVFEGDSAVYVLSLMNNYRIITKVNKQEYDRLSTSFISYVSDDERANQHFGDFVATASKLYQLLFHDIAVPFGRIIISPDGKYFPFEALVASVNSSGPIYFIDEHAVSYTYSARYLLNHFDNDKNFRAKNFMGFAPVKFDPNLRLPTLAGSDESLDRVESHFNRSDNWLTANATRKNFLDNFYRYKIIQLYTHATDSGLNNEPVIYFTDSALLLSDLFYENRPATSLIVLSACETGTGRLYEGEGVFSFNRGFAALGIPTSIANLWQVENKSTYKLTELFYQYLADGLPVDVALQKAKLDFIKSSGRDRQLPYYWAAPILTGRTEPITLNKSFAWIYIVAGLSLAALAYASFRNWRKRRTINT